MYRQVKKDRVDTLLGDCVYNRVTSWTEYYL